MIVVADTSPIHYLLLIGQIDLLPLLFQQVVIPEIVRDEMLDPGAPTALREWIANPPSWLVVRAVSTTDKTLSTLDPGEQAAITLAQALPADLLVIDERLGRRLAGERGLNVIGTLGILDAAASQGLVDLSNAVAQLQQTNFRISRKVIQALLNQQIS